MSVEKVILIDTDPGGDDAFALFMGLAAQRDLVTPPIRIVGITTVCGNSGIDCMANNATRILDTVNDTTTPIYKGMGKYVMKTFEHIEDPPYFGEDGFGDANLPTIPTRVEEEHAVNAIIRLAKTYQGELVIVCLGPLTNLAMALNVEPKISDWIKEVYILGGNINGVGNVGPFESAEFNFYVDPEAANIVLSGINQLIFVLPWETILQHVSPIEFRKETLGTMLTPEIILMNQVEAKHLDEEGRIYWVPPDAMLMACVIDSAVATTVVQEHCDVELFGSLTRGMMVVDRVSASIKPKNVNVIMSLDQARYEKMLVWASGGPPPFTTV